MGALVRQAVEVVEEGEGGGMVVEGQLMDMEGKDKGMGMGLV